MVRYPIKDSKNRDREMLIQEIKADRLAARRENDLDTYTTLTTLLSEIARLEKVDQKNDQKVQAVITKCIKGLTEMIAILEVSESMEKEKELLLTYLPQQMEREELLEAIKCIADDVGAESPRDMGKIMSGLKKSFNGQYDGKLASELVREYLK